MRNSNAYAQYEKKLEMASRATFVGPYDGSSGESSPSAPTTVPNKRKIVLIDWNATVRRSVA